MAKFLINIGCSIGLMKFLFLFFIFHPLACLSQGDSLYLIIKVVDKETGLPISAHLEILNLKHKVLFEEDINNTFEAKINRKENLVFSLKKDYYLFYSENIIVVNQKQDSIINKIELTKILLEPFYKFPNLYFNTFEMGLSGDTLQLKELNKIAQFLTINSDIKLLVEGHCDSIEIKNEKNISQLRAKSVYDYLISNGINKKRIEIKVYDAQRPIYSNSTEKGRNYNRRVEFKIYN